MLFEILIVIFVLYILYKLVFDFIVPVSKTASHFKSQVNQMKNMQEEMLRQQQQKQTQGSASASKTKPSSAKNTTITDGEYIDFEEVK